MYVAQGDGDIARFLFADIRHLDFVAGFVGGEVLGELSELVNLLAIDGSDDIARFDARLGGSSVGGDFVHIDARYAT